MPIECDFKHPPPLNFHEGVKVFVFLSVSVPGDDMEHEQDTVLQLQEVIEQLRNVFPSEPGKFMPAAWITAK